MFAAHIRKRIDAACAAQGIASVAYDLKHPDVLAHGDYATNVALVAAKQLQQSPRDIAAALAEAITPDDVIARVEVAGPGFINFFLHDTVLHGVITLIHEHPESFGRGTLHAGKRMMFEYTDPNPFKVFHIGHLMSNAIGEALARLAEWQGGEVIRANYQSDVGLHIARAIFGMLALKQSMPSETAPLREKTQWLGKCYVHGTQADERAGEEAKEIKILNHKIFEKTDEKINQLYTLGRQWSLAHFEELYRVLGSRFDKFYFESEVAEPGKRLVLEYLEKGVFEHSEGAIIFDGEKRGLHKRVFITSENLPTYEAKEIGLNIRKFREEPKLDQSVIITAQEQNDYMKVAIAAIREIDPTVADRMRHFTHGMMLGADGKKMSSRKGEVISGEGLLEEIREEVRKKLTDGKHEFSASEGSEVADKVAVAGIKYTILKQHFGKNIIFDRAAALSFEGDSGPYLQYTYARAQSVLRKAATEGLNPSVGTECDAPQTLERYLYRFPEVTVLAAETYTPNYLTTYLVEVAQLFNSYYGNTKIIDATNPTTPYRLALTAATAHILRNGLTILGIPTIDRM